MPTCAQGHGSADEEFCDVCGLAFGTPAASPVPTVAEPEPADRECPACGAPLSGRFCEDCGADSLTASPPNPAVATESPAPPEAVESTASAEPVTWSVVVSADRRYYNSVCAEGGPDAGAIGFPPFCPERRFVLAGEQVTIGRRSRTRGIEPDIDLTGPPEDPGVSRLHALLVADATGWSIVDMNSANGTYVNYTRESLKPNTPRPLANGDCIHVGAWTTITVHGS
ncbi:MAG TPA: FHA domain-containing protein [Amycolatopsis sp.]|uniref:FHA domain-containing protein n=1 Tax=Amycolatopsis sp. TaxID=37632 RepID=UPI002B48FFEE|nr:FHA domain-containing protein [Amycolatopsis sp.]HKS46505.1 FHA domain-containing protein [Amycolatopsis sp.]